MDDGIVDTLVSALRQPSKAPAVIERQLTGVVGDGVVGNVDFGYVSAMDRAALDLLSMPAARMEIILLLARS